MFLKALQIHGFKSFADKTKLEFHEGVTGIVGPNGCGKSNIVDSIRWVLGETSAKALRGGEMADVIFNGTDKRSPLGMAEVQLTLSNCEGVLETEFNEVAIGRRVYRDGKGEYLINNSPCRLRDIHELLMDTGIGRSSYSIMEQGKIDMLLSSKPEDRRAVFEEAAGITKFKTQKKEALRKLDYTEANLVRLADIVEEVERQMRSLERQAKKAKRYQVLHTDVRVLDLHYSHKLWREYRAESAELETSVAALRQQQAELEAEVESRQEAVTEARDAYSKIEARVAEVQAEIVERENAIQAANNRIEFNSERVHELSVLIGQHETDIENTAEKLTQEKSDLFEADTRLESVTKKIAEREQQLESFREAVTAARTEREEINKRLSEIRGKRNQLESTMAALDAKIESGTRQLDGDQKRFVQLGGELARIEKEIATRSEEAGKLRDELGNQRSKIADQEETLAAAEAIDRKFKREHDDIQSEVSEFFRFNAEKASRLEVLRQLVADGEGFEKGTQAVLKGLDKPKIFKKVVRGALANFIKVDKKFVAAVEAALGKNLQAIIVADESSAEKMIGTLKEGHLGEALLVSETDSAGTGSERQLEIVPGKGAHGWALDKIESHKRVAALVDHLLSDVLIVEDLATALRLRKEASGRTAFATIAGEFITADGVIHGGSTGEDGGGSVLQRQTEIRTLEKVTRKLADDLGKLEAKRVEYHARVEKSEVTILQQRERLQKQQVNFSTLEGQLALVQRDVAQLDNNKESLGWEQQAVAQRQDELEESLTASKQERELAATELDTLAHEITELNAKFEFAETRERESGEQLNDLNTSLAVDRNELEALQTRRQPMVARIAELESLHERRGKEIASYRERIENGTNENRELQAKIDAAQSEMAELGGKVEQVRSERSSFTADIQETELNLTEWRKKIQEFAGQRGREEVKLTQIQLRLENIESSGRERYQMELERFEPDSHALLAVIEDQRKAHSRNEKRRATIAGEELQNEAASAETDSEDEFQLEDPSEPDWDFVEEIVAGLRTRLDSMGPVNLDAIAEFEELEERHKFLQEQVTDLTDSKEELLRVIQKINRDTRKMFAETFAHIKVNFQEMFKELFGDKGKADLILMDESDPLESGIEVIAKPPGKKLQSITLLSGGERSMTAVALLFAIYMVKPSPFCVLDELDAPLDEANIGRFIRVLDRFIGDSQFIIVTHSKRTMSRADVMYGVSMEEFGVSKTVGVKFSDSDAKTEDSKVAPIGG